MYVCVNKQFIMRENRFVFLPRMCQTGLEDAFSPDVSAGYMSAARYGLNESVADQGWPSRKVFAVHGRRNGFCNTI